MLPPRRAAPRFAFALPLLLASTAFARTCDSLASLTMLGASVSIAHAVPAGEFEPTAGAPMAYPALPAFCRIRATLRPTSDSEIRIEVWLPDPRMWNGKFAATGNGGWGGSFNYADMADMLARGYATSSTDTGHIGGSASFALGHPEKLVDFGYRSIHEMTLTAKAIIDAYFGNYPKLSYFSGCSSGGRQALMEAQRFPGDYDGIIAGAATNNWTNMMFGRIWVAQATLSDPAGYISPVLYPVIHRAVLDACDALDGVKDGVLEDPTRCHFDPAILQCKGGAPSSSCLTAAQVKAARRIYAPTRNPTTGEEIFPPMMPGSELVWKTLAGGPKPIALADDFFKYVVFANPAWDFRTLNFSTDWVKARDRDAGTLSATNPDLAPFFAHGGKLIQYHGWTDQQVMPLNSIHYFESVVALLGAHATDDIRLFMVPGMNHCGHGDGPNTFDMLTQLEQWREHGHPPDAIPASHSTNGRVDRTRPLCAYPEVSRYKGTGSTDSAASFACVRP
jgi:feruloyl esterase